MYWLSVDETFNILLDSAAVSELLRGLSSCLICSQLAGLFRESSFSADLTSLVRICGPSVIKSHGPGGLNEHWVSAELNPSVLMTLFRHDSSHQCPANDLFYFDFFFVQA